MDAAAGSEPAGGGAVAGDLGCSAVGRDTGRCIADDLSDLVE
jgi:hypothetical protein